MSSKTAQKEKIITSGLRDSLKSIIQNEIQKIPTILESLEPKERIHVICKLLPFVFPKVESVSHDQGEPGEGWSFK